MLDTLLEYAAARLDGAGGTEAACTRHGAHLAAFDLYASALSRVPGPLAAGYQQGRERPTALLGRILSLMERQPTSGWAPRRRQQVHGAAGPLAYFAALREYTLAGRAGQIQCPTFVANAQGDDISASAPQLAAALTGPNSSSPSPPPKAPVTTANPAPAPCSTVASSPGSTPS